jgi:protoporphyrinogen oxidase
MKKQFKVELAVGAPPLILGAGLSGLGCARANPGARVFEAADHPGGHAYSHEVGGVHFDEGAHICHAKDPDWLALLYGAAGEVERIDASQVSNYWQGHWVSYPVQNHLCELPLDARVAAMKGFVQALAERRSGEPKNYLEWCRAQYGDYLTDHFYRLYTDKYWRVSMEELGTDWLGGRLLPSQVDRIVEGAFGVPQDSQAVFAQFHYPARGGFFSFFRSLYDRLDVRYGMKAVEVRPGQRQVVFENGQVEEYEKLASSIPLPDLVGMIPDAPSDVRAAAACLRHVQLLCVYLIVDRPDLTPCHWFYVYDPEIEISRVKVNSNVAPKSVPTGQTALQAEIFRRPDEPMPVEELVAGAVADLGRLLNFAAADVRAVEPQIVPHAYIISDHQRAAAVDCIIPWLEGQGIYPMGLFGRWKFIWSDAAYRSGRESVVGSCASKD